MERLKVNYVVIWFSRIGGKLNTENPSLEEVERIAASCKRLETCTIDFICSPLIGRKQADLLSMSGRAEQIMLAQVVYYCQELAELSAAHIYKTDSFVRMLSTVDRLLTKKSKRKLEEEEIK